MTPGYVYWCPDCDGFGVLCDAVCASCEGAGKITEAEVVTLGAEDEPLRKVAP